MVFCKRQIAIDTNTVAAGDADRAIVRIDEKMNTSLHSLFMLYARLWVYIAAMR